MPERVTWGAFRSGRRNDTRGIEERKEAGFFGRQAPFLKIMENYADSMKGVGSEGVVYRAVVQEFDRLGQKMPVFGFSGHRGQIPNELGGKKRGLKCHLEGFDGRRGDFLR